MCMHKDYVGKFLYSPSPSGEEKEDEHWETSIRKMWFNI